MTPDYRPKGIGRLIDEAIAVYRAEFRTLALPALYLLLPLSLVSSLAQNAYIRALRGAANSTDPFAVLARVSGAYSALVVAASLIGVAALYYFNAVMQQAPALLTRAPVAPGAFLKAGWKRFLMLWVTGIVMGIAAGFGLLFLLVPGFLLYVYLSMAEPVVGVEGAPIDVAFRRSVSLVRENFWRTVGFFAAILVIIGSLQSALTSVTSIQLILTSISGVNAGGPLPSLGWQVLGGLAQGVAQALTLPLFYVAWLLFYLDLRSRREGMDLLARAQALAARPL